MLAEIMIRTNVSGKKKQFFVALVFLGGHKLHLTVFDQILRNLGKKS